MQKEQLKTEKKLSPGLAILLLLFMLSFAGLMQSFLNIKDVQSRFESKDQVFAAENFSSVIDIDSYADKHRPNKKGTIDIIRPREVTFSASVKQYPHSRDTSYFYEVLQFFPMEPQPKVNHRMFISTPQGKIIPVYVEDSLVPKIKKYLKEEGERVNFTGYHIYTYSKGPAFFITAFDLGASIPGSESK